VWVNVHRLPENREIIGYLFPTWAAALAAMHEISTSDAEPTVTRVSDANETAFSFSTQKASKGISGRAAKVLFQVLERRGWDLDAACLSFIGYEGGADHVKRQKSIVGKIVRKHGGIKLGKGPGALYDQKKFDTPYIRDFLLDRGAPADVSETSAPWGELQTLYDNVMAAGYGAFDELGVPGYLMCHLSHSYHAGACLYFTVAINPPADGDALEMYGVVKRAIQQAFVDSGATLSHHHAVGTEHAQWLEEDISSPGVAMLQSLFEGFDPGGNLNPGKIVSRRATRTGLSTRG
jgi:alkyldihydroxyacetonephosphate synthase